MCAVDGSRAAFAPFHMQIVHGISVYDQEGILVRSEGFFATQSVHQPASGLSPSPAASYSLIQRSCSLVQFPACPPRVAARPETKPRSRNLLGPTNSQSREECA